MLIRAEEAIQKANRVLRQCGTRNADRIARELGLIVMPRDFSRQKGAYMVIERNRYIFINAIWYKPLCSQKFNKIYSDADAKTQKKEGKIWGKTTGF